MNSKGFTLMEMVVAIGIFSVCIVIIVGVFTNFTSVERHGIAQGQVISDLESALESFIKEARTAYGSTYNGNGNIMVFKNQEGACIGYRVIEGVFMRADAGSVGECIPDRFSNVTRFVPLTSQGTKMTSVHFDFIPSEVDPDNTANILNQGMITIRLRALSNVDTVALIEIQNTVASRQMNAFPSL